MPHGAIKKTAKDLVVFEPKVRYALTGIIETDTPNMISNN